MSFTLVKHNPSFQDDHELIRDFVVRRELLELILELPWNKRTDDNLDIARARQVLD